MKNLKNVFAIVATLCVVFLSGCKKDEDPSVTPTVKSSTPLNNATNVALGSNISIKFSVPMDPATITSTQFTVKQGTTDVAGVVTYTDTTAVFNPTANFTANKIYSVKMTTGAKSMASQALAHDYTFSFTSGAAPDVTAPTVSLLDPLANATGVAINKAVSVTFSEAMDPLTITSSTFTLKQGTSAVAGVVTYSGVKATFT